MKPGTRTVLTLALVFVAVAVAPADLWASTGGTAMPWEGPLQKILDSLTGTTGKILTAVMFVIAGATWGLSRNEEGARKFFQGAVGGAILMSSVQIAGLLGFAGALM